MAESSSPENKKDCGCKADPGSIEAACEVCKYAKGDESVKTVRYCSWCKAWMCSACREDWPARMKAALARGLQGGGSDA